MHRWLPRRLALAGIGSLVASALAVGCGFDDTLTRRGFIQEGDAVCGTTFVEATIALQSDTSIPQARGVQSLAAAYADASRRLSGLAVDDEDAAMRDRMEQGFRELAGDLEAASEGPDVQGAAVEAFARTRPLVVDIRDYGFVVCGGRAPADRSASTNSAT